MNRFVRYLLLSGLFLIPATIMAEERKINYTDPKPCLAMMKQIEDYGRHTKSRYAGYVFSYQIIGSAEELQESEGPFFIEALESKGPFKIIWPTGDVKQFADFIQKKQFTISSWVKEDIEDYYKTDAEGNYRYPELLYYDLSKSDHAIVITFDQRVSPEIRPFRIIGKPPHQELIDWQPGLTYNVMRYPADTLIISFQGKRHFLTNNTSFYYYGGTDPKVPKGYFEYVINLYLFGQDPAKESECQFGVLFKQHKKDFETGTFVKTRLRH